MSKKVIFVFLLLCLTFSTAGTAFALDSGGTASAEASAPDVHKKNVVAGYLENVTVLTEHMESPIDVEAKLDTGADSSSLHATDIKIDEAEKQVSFTLPYNGKEQRVTCNYVKIVRIKTRPSGHQRRAVIPVELHIGAKKLDALINLTDRSHFKYKMLIGRKELRRGILIDSSRAHILDALAN